MICIFTDNIALHKPTSQLGAWGTFYSNLAVDGNTNQDLYDGRTCAHPFSQMPRMPAWWRVDLAGGDPSLRFVIMNVTIYFRADCCPGTCALLFNLQSLLCTLALN